MEDFDQTARQWHDYYLALIQAGFGHEDAMRIICIPRTEIHQQSSPSIEEFASKFALLADRAIADNT